VAAGVAAAAAVGLICSTGVGCVILAGAVAGAVSAGYGYGYDVAQGEHPWDWGDFGTDVAIGGVTGAATAGLLHGAGKLVKGGLSKLRGGGGKPSAAPKGAPSAPSAPAPKPAPAPAKPAPAKPSNSPPQLPKGKAWELDQLKQLGKPPNETTWRPTEDQIRSAAFNVIVGPAKYTRGGKPLGVKVDSAGLELKHGTKALESSYQLRLMTYRALVVNEPLVIRTTRVPNPEFAAWLQRWGVKVDMVP
jgi:hypothetical protein